LKKPHNTDAAKEKILHIHKAKAHNKKTAAGTNKSARSSLLYRDLLPL